MRRWLFLVALCGAVRAETVLAVPFFNHTASANMDWIGESIAETLRDAMVPEGVLVLADMFGGSAANVSAGFLATAKVEVVTGVNLPMLLEAMLARNNYKDVKSFAKYLAEKSRGSIINLGDIHKTCR